VRDVQDVLAAVELAITGRPGIVPPRATAAVTGGAGPGSGVEAEAPSPTAALILRVLDDDPASLDTVVRRSSLALAEVAEALEQLDGAGLAAGTGGWWSRRSRQ
jgi:predicted Rossmann fold nucleotide-binding protein DprA/Smf involved in DNA uptake